LKGFQSGSSPRFEEEKKDEGANSKEEFLKKWLEVAPSTLDPPSFAADFSAKKEPVPEGAPVPSKLTFNFYLPHDKPYTSAEVDMVLVPAVTGDFGVMPGHVPTSAQLRPGVLTVQEDEQTSKKFFVSSGFAFVHADSTAEVCAIEAFPVEDLDQKTVEAGLADYTAKLANATGSGDDYEAAAAQIGVEVYSAMNSAITDNKA
jgi:F-type H+-transporting ATPase subunit delta